jgi:hypothetical protein
VILSSYDKNQAIFVTTFSMIFGFLGRRIFILEPPGISRMNAQKATAKLYDSRSAAALGSEEKKGDSLQETYAVGRKALLKMIETNRMPTHVELEAKLFGADPQ